MKIFEYENVRNNKIQSNIYINCHYNIRVVTKSQPITCMHDVISNETRNYTNENAISWRFIESLINLRN